MTIDNLSTHAIVFTNKNLTTDDVVCILNMTDGVDVSYQKRIEIGEIKQPILVNVDEYDSIGKYVSCNRIYNDKEIAIIGTNPGSPRNVAGLLRNGDYNKFYRYIVNNYKNLIDAGNAQSFNGNTPYKFKTSLQKCLGNVVQYLAEYFVYGDKFLKPYICNIDHLNNTKLIYACIQRYRDELIRVYNVPSHKTYLPSLNTLEENKRFINVAVKLAGRTAEFLKLHGIRNTNKLHSYNLSNAHIKGLADFITEDKIIDIKCTNHLGESDVMQLLGYYYLSTKRNDLHIKELIAYDAISGKCIKINI